MLKPNRSKRSRVYFLSSAIVISLVAAHVFLKSVYVVPILMYHNIDENYKSSKLSVSPQSFQKQMKFLRGHRYNMVSLEELVDIISSKKSIPYKTIAITFDDGYENNYTNAFPVLKRYSIPASMFVVVDKIGREGYMDWGELREMAKSDIEIGSHTLSECFLPDIKDEKALKDEIFRSREVIKSKIPSGGDIFGYCSGGFNKKIRQLVIDAGYKGAFATNPGKNYPKNDIYALKRLRISRTSDNPFVFWLEASGFYTWIKEHRDKD